MARRETWWIVAPQKKTPITEFPLLKYTGYVTRLVSPSL